MTDSPWNPPTGPPNGVPLRAADARREIDDAIAAAQAGDRALRDELAAATAARVQASDRLEVAVDEVEEACSLAKSALTRANDAARAGQRAEAGKWTAAAQVFAMRLRDGREEVAGLEARLAIERRRAERVQSDLAANIGRLEAVAAARLPVLGGRKAAKAQREVDDTVAALAAPTDDLVAGAVRAAHAAVDEALQDGAPVVVADDDLESEVDVESTDGILAELRTELGLPAVPADATGTPGTPGTPGDSAGAAGAPGTPGDAAGTDPAVGATASGTPVHDTAPGAPEGRAGPDSARADRPDRTAPGAAAAPSGRRGKAGGGRSWPVPSARR